MLRWGGHGWIPAWNTTLIDICIYIDHRYLLLSIDISIRLISLDWHLRRLRRIIGFAGGWGGRETRIGGRGGGNGSDAGGDADAVDAESGGSGAPGADSRRRREWSSRTHRQSFPGDPTSSISSPDSTRSHLDPFFFRFFYRFFFRFFFRFFISPESCSHPPERGGGGGEG